MIKCHGRSLHLANWKWTMSCEMRAEGPCGKQYNFYHILIVKCSVWILILMLTVWVYESNLSNANAWKWKCGHYAIVRHSHTWLIWMKKRKLLPILFKTRISNGSNWKYYERSFALVRVIKPNTYEHFKQCGNFMWILVIKISSIFTAVMVIVLLKIIFCFQIQKIYELKLTIWCRRSKINLNHMCECVNNW